MMESLVGFILFSLVLMIYLPSYQQELYRMNRLSHVSLQMQTFYDLVTIQTQADPNMGLAQDLEKRMALYNQLNTDQVVSFSCEALLCGIEFSDGAVYQTELIDISLREN